MVLDRNRDQNFEFWSPTALFFKFERSRHKAELGHFEGVVSHFSKGIWERKLFGMPNGIVQCGYGGLNLNFGSQRLYFSNLKSLFGAKNNLQMAVFWSFYQFFTLLPP